MPFNLDTFEQTLNKVFKQIQKDQSKTLSIQISANFTAGMSSASKTKSIQSTEEDEGLTDAEKAVIALLVAEYLGYLSKFNSEAKKQILSNVTALNQEGGEKAVKAYLDDVFEGKETITIDNTGKKKKEIYVDKDLKLSEVSRTIEKPFFAALGTYASLLGDTVAHTAYEAGKTAKNQKDGFESWVFSGPADERARPHHIAILGSRFEYNTEQSEYAERCLKEPRCRHRKVPYYGDDRDVSVNTWRKLKEGVGLRWDDSLKRWAID